MEKIFFKKSKNNAICYRYPNDYTPDSVDDFIEVESNEQSQNTMFSPYGKIWIVQDGKPVLVDDAEVQNSDEYKAFVRKNIEAGYKSYLSSTDYVISKLNELKLEDEEEYEKAKEEYKEVLAKRKEARAKINELERS